MAGLPPAAAGGSGSGLDATVEVTGGLPFEPPEDPLMGSSVVEDATGCGVVDEAVTLVVGAVAVPGLLGLGSADAVGVPVVEGALLATGAVPVPVAVLDAPVAESTPGLSVSG